MICLLQNTTRRMWVLFFFSLSHILHGTCVCHTEQDLQQCYCTVQIEWASSLLGRNPVKVNMGCVLACVCVCCTVVAGVCVRERERECVYAHVYVCAIWYTSFITTKHQLLLLWRVNEMSSFNNRGLTHHPWVGCAVFVSTLRLLHDTSDAARCALRARSLYWRQTSMAVKVTSASLSWRFSNLFFILFACLLLVFMCRKYQS